MSTGRPALVAAAALTPVVLLGVVLCPQLWARLTGREYRLAVEPVDPVDPFRGAYVELSYPGLPRAGHDGRVYVPLVRAGDVWTGTAALRERPRRGPYLACRGRDGTLDCGVGSLFRSESGARRIERTLSGHRAVAVLKVDESGNAALIRVEARPRG